MEPEEGGKGFGSKVVKSLRNQIIRGKQISRQQATFFYCLCCCSIIAYVTLLLLLCYFSISAYVSSTPLRLMEFYFENDCFIVTFIR